VISEVKQYGEMILLDIRDTQPDDWALCGVTNIRVGLPSSPEHENIMRNKGFIWADRTIGTSISIPRCSLDLNRLVRMEIEETSDYKDEILRIAASEFIYDRRFHICPECDMSVARSVLKEWVEVMDKCLVCMYKNAPVGFLALKEIAPDALFIHLAAVMEKYRTAGVAMSLYAKALQLANDRGYKKLNGRISTLNVSVMNLYAYLGANFSEPEDIYLKELK
jgi:GNAT superfamily N-acetyltransferase